MTAHQNDQHHTQTPETSALAASQSHFRETHDELQQIGEGTFGLTYIAYRKIDTTAHRDDETVTSQLASEQQLLVVKYYKPVVEAPLKPQDLMGEIAALQFLAAGQHPHIQRLLDVHTQGPVQWMTTPFYRAGDLENFRKRHQDRLTSSFIWHIAYCVSNAMLYICFGVPSNSVGMEAEPVSD